MARNPEDLNKKFIRSKPRGLVMIYDLVGFAAAFYFLFFWYYPAAYREAWNSWSSLTCRIGSDSSVCRISRSTAPIRS